jgi:HK97 family phage portal protein
MSRRAAFRALVRSAAALVMGEKAFPPSLSGVPGSGGWWPIIRESFAGAFQSNITVEISNVLTFAALYRCIVLISSDIGKLRIKLMQEDSPDIWSEVQTSPFLPVLRKPNHYQTRIQFLQQWMTSKLIHGNTYVLKQRESSRGLVNRLYVLDPMLVRPMVSSDGAVWYQLKADNLIGLDEQPLVPASEIIHDVENPLYHPLVGISPITACGVAAVQGLRIQENQTMFFAQGSIPSGVLSAPGVIKQETADRLKAYWEANFSGENVGKVAVLGDGLAYQQMRMSATDSQLIEQLGMTGEIVCTAMGVPRHMIGIGPEPNYNNIQALTVQYYTQRLQNLIESIEELLDRGLELPTAPRRLGVELDLDDLLRMDTATSAAAAKDAIGSGAVAPNEARSRFYGLPPVTGGDQPYLQQQNYSLEALAKRDARADPFAKTSSGNGSPASEPALAAASMPGQRLLIRARAKAMADTYDRRAS